MLLVVAIVGGAIFTTIQNSSQIQSTSSLANADVQIDNFGVTTNGLEMEVRATSADQLENVNISLIDQETGETVYTDEEKTIPVAGKERVSLNKVGNSENTNTYTVNIQYDNGGLNDLTTNGTITGRITINRSSTPTVETLSATNINTNNATLKGKITDTGGETPDTRFNYGTDQSSLSNTVEAGINTREYSSTITGLSSGTTYYFEAEANNTQGTSTGNIQSFTTSTKTIDNFEDGSLSEYTDSGSNNVWSISSNQAYNGTNSLKVSPDDGKNIYYRSADFSAGEKLKTYFYPTADGSGNSGFVFGYSGSSSFYEIQLVTWSDTIRIRKDSTTSNSIANGDCNFGANQWYEVIVDWASNGNIDATVNDASTNSQVCSLSASDSSHSSGDIGFVNDGPKIHYWDLVKKP